MHDPRGFTLAEVLIAVAIIAIGLAAIAMGFGMATTGVETGRQQTAAVLLAEQRMEQMRGRIIASFADPAAAPGAADEGYDTIPNGASYRRQTVVADFDTDADGVADLKRVTVDVYYRPLTERGLLRSERKVRLVNIVSRRQ